MHSARLLILASFFSISKQRPRHTFMQLPQPVHLLSSIFMKAPVSPTHSTPGYLSDVLTISSFLFTLLYHFVRKIAVIDPSLHQMRESLVEIGVVSDLERKKMRSILDWVEVLQGWCSDIQS